MKKIYLIPFLSLITIFSVFVLLDVFCPLDVSKAKNVSQQILGRGGEILHVTLSSDDMYRLSTSHEAISPLYLKFLMAREDQRFSTHWGVDLRAVIRAMLQNIKHGRIVSGASTLTMQTIRLLQPRSRTLTSKLVEMFRAFQLEWHYSKNEILDMYLTLVPCGGNIEGIAAASHAYFGKTPAHLSVAEASFLVMLPQSPTRLRPDRFPEEARLKRDEVLRHFHNAHLITEEELSYALSESPPQIKYTFPRDIPHFLASLKPQGSLVQSFIDGGLQRFVAERLKHADHLPKGANAALLVHDHKANKVVAYAGSRDFFDKENAGQVDYIQAIRSPGSTLKPLIFGLAMDGGHISPETYFFDERKHFGAYAPHNFDHQHYGLVRGAESLQMSLNVPAVELLKKIGPIYFYGVMKEMNITPRFKDSDVMPNLSMALGGVGVALSDLVKLYSTFAEEGMCQELRYFGQSEKTQPHYVLYPRIAQQLTEILKVNPLNIRGHLGDRPIALKTGTSYGHRDALAIGYDAQYTVGVWVGMPKGTPLGAQTGLELAVPFIDALFQKLPRPKHDKPSRDLDLAPLFKTKIMGKEHVFVSPQELIQRSLVLHYPLDGSKIFYDPHRALSLKIGGGKKPYKLFINGELATDVQMRDDLPWQPPKEGFYTLTVQDAEGECASAEIEVGA